jgi:hypothetical protein
MAKESIAKENPVAEALRKLKEEELELVTRLKPLQEAIAALEKIVEKSSKKVKSPSKDSADSNTEESMQESMAEA